VEDVLGNPGERGEEEDMSDDGEPDALTNALPAPLVFVFRDFFEELVGFVIDEARGGVAVGSDAPVSTEPASAGLVSSATATPEDAGRLPVSPGVERFGLAGVSLGGIRQKWAARQVCHPDRVQDVRLTPLYSLILAVLRPEADLIRVRCGPAGPRPPRPRHRMKACRLDVTAWKLDVRSGGKYPEEPFPGEQTRLK
jgi:hypothetical protein